MCNVNLILESYGCKKESYVSRKYDTVEDRGEHRNHETEK